MYNVHEYFVPVEQNLVMYNVHEYFVPVEQNLVMYNVHEYFVPVEQNLIMYKDLCTTKASVFLKMITSCRAKKKYNFKNNIYKLKIKLKSIET